LLDERSVEKRSGALIQALAALQEGSRYEDPRLQDEHQAPHTSNKTLSGRQLEILALVAEGLSNRVIAQQLQISSNTVRDHLSEIMLRLDVNNRASAVSSALRRGLMP
ncbi:DNA-binding response regulator, partial [Pseudomonas sp. HMWF031]